MSQTTHGSLVLLGINHNTAPIELRERLAISAERLADATRTLLHQPGIREGLILSTCNRVELLTLQDDAADTTDATTDTSSVAYIGHPQVNTTGTSPPCGGRARGSFILGYAVPLPLPLP